MTDDRPRVAVSTRCQPGVNCPPLRGYSSRGRSQKVSWGQPCNLINVSCGRKRMSVWTTAIGRRGVGSHSRPAGSLIPVSLVLITAPALLCPALLALRPRELFVDKEAGQGRAGQRQGRGRASRCSGEEGAATPRGRGVEGEGRGVALHYSCL